MIALFGRKLDTFVRPLRDQWIPACVAIHGGAFARGWDAEEFRTLLRDPSMIADAAVDGPGNTLQGFAMTRHAADEAEILTIAIDPAFRRRGLGRLLLAAHLKRLAGSGVRNLFLEVDATNAAALTLYDRLEFKKVGERAGYYRHADGSTATALILRKFLS